MIKILTASIIGGLLLAAPFGPVGALVADAALVHDRRRLYTTILAAVTGEGLLAFLISFSSSHAREFLSEYEKIFCHAAGILVISLGVVLAARIRRSGEHGMGRGEPDAPAKRFGHMAPSLGVFLLTLLNPGTAAAFLVLAAYLSLKHPAFADHRGTFAAGIAIGSLLAFSPVGLVFWKIRARAERFVLYLRYALTAMIGIAGLYLLTRGF